LICITLPASAYADSKYFSLKSDEGFKRFSVSAGWSHTMPQGAVTSMDVISAAKSGTYRVGDVSKSVVADAAVRESNPALYDTIMSFPADVVPAAVTGSVQVDSLASWTNHGTGLEATKGDAFGMMFNYHFTDNLSLQIKGGIPPKVRIKGVGTTYSPLRGTNITPLGDIELKRDTYITNLEQGSSASTARAWLPAVELHYQFGKTGENKLRPYVGAGLVYAHFGSLKLNSVIEAEVAASGHMIQNILDGEAGPSIEGKPSSASPVVKVKTTDVFAPVLTLGTTYDLNSNWFVVGSVSYMPMDSKAKVYVNDANTGRELVYTETRIDINPIVTYLGIGYRF